MKSRRRLPPLLALTAAFLVFCPKSARAEGDLDFAWSAPANCPDRAAILREIEGILHGPIQLGEGERLVVRANVRPPPVSDPWHVDIETDDGERKAERSVDAATCEDIAAATALFVAVLIDARAASAISEEAAEPEQREAPPPSKAIDADVNRSPERTTSPFSPAAGITLGVAGGYLPHWSPGVGLYALVGWKSLRAKLGGQALLPARRTIDDAGAQGADFQLYSSNVDLCLEWPLASFALGPCAGADLAYMTGKGFGPGVASKNGGAAFAGLALGGTLRWMGPGRFSLPLQLEAIAPLTRPLFVFMGPAGTSVHRPGSLAGRVTLAVEIRL